MKTLKSIQFWIAALAALAVWLTAAAGSLPVAWAAYISTGSVVAYAISRALTKYGTDLKQSYKSTEFWLGVAQIVVMVATAIPGDISAKVVTLLSAAIAAVYMVVRAVATPSVKASKTASLIAGIQAVHIGSTSEKPAEPKTTQGL